MSPAPGSSTVSDVAVKTGHRLPIVHGSLRPSFAVSHFPHFVEPDPAERDRPSRQCPAALKGESEWQC